MHYNRNINITQQVLPIKVIVFTYKKISKTSAIAVNLEIFNFETFKFRLLKL